MWRLETGGRRIGSQQAKQQVAAVACLLATMLTAWATTHWLVVLLAVTQSDRPSFHEASTKDGTKFKNWTIQLFYIGFRTKDQNETELKSECSIIIYTKWTIFWPTYVRCKLTAISYYLQLQQETRGLKPANCCNLQLVWWWFWSWCFFHLTFHKTTAHWHNPLLRWHKYRHEWGTSYELILSLSHHQRK